MTDRLLELAWAEAMKQHMENVCGGEDLNGHGWKFRDDQGFSICPHPDCTLVREVAASGAGATPRPQCAEGFHIAVDLNTDPRVCGKCGFRWPNPGTKAGAGPQPPLDTRKSK